MKYLKKETKIFLISLIIFALIFGGVFYVFLLLTLLYITLYAYNFKNITLNGTFSLSQYTVTQNNSFKLFYTINLKSFLPIKASYEVLYPYYIVPVSNSKRKIFFGRSLEESGEVTLRGNRRGTYEVGSMEVYIIDPFSLFSTLNRINKPNKIFVFPFLVPIEKLKIKLTDPYEGLKAKYRINFDYSYVASVREYTTSDPVSLIHWKQTAHQNKLMVKEFDFSASKKIYVAHGFSEIFANELRNLGYDAIALV